MTRFVDRATLSPAPEPLALAPVSEPPALAPGAGGPDGLSVLVAEPHAGLRDALVGLLDHEPGFDVRSCRQWTEMARSVAEQPPDVVLLHRRLMGADDEHAVATVHSLVPDAAVLLTGMQTGDDFVTMARRAGADGYVPLDVRPETLLAKIGAAHRAHGTGPTYH